MVDKGPLLVARCAEAVDVIAAVNFGRDNKPSIAICEAATTDLGSPASTTVWCTTCRR